MDLKDYIRGQRHGKEANQLERKAMNDPFLQDAIDGYDSVEGNHASAVEKLEKRLSAPQKRTDKRVWIWAAAAVIALLVGIPFLLRQPDVKKDIQVASAEKTETEQDVFMPVPQKDTPLIADNKSIEKEASPKAQKVIVAEEADAFRVPAQQEVIKQEDNLLLADKTIEKVELREINQPVTDQLQGKVAGVAVTSGEKTGGNFRIRGVSHGVQPNDMRVTGRIVDETGEPLIGVSVNLKNTTMGTVTDTDGNFRLTVPKDEKELLVANYVGMHPQEMPLKENMGDIIMKSDEMALNEVVVVGYGTQRKSSYTGSVSKAKDTIPVFGETEFTKYFKENYDKEICSGKAVAFTVEFYIDAQGRPGTIAIKENNCPKLELEIKRLLPGSPLWSERNRKVTLNLKINEQP